MKYGTHVLVTYTCCTRAARCSGIFYVCYACNADRGWPPSSAPPLPPCWSDFCVVCGLPSGCRASGACDVAPGTGTLAGLWWISSIFNAFIFLCFSWMIELALLGSGTMYRSLSVVCQLMCANVSICPFFMITLLPLLSTSSRGASSPRTASGSLPSLASSYDLLRMLVRWICRHLMRTSLTIRFQSTAITSSSTSEGILYWSSERARSKRFLMSSSRSCCSSRTSDSVSRDAACWSRISCAFFCAIWRSWPGKSRMMLAKDSTQLVPLMMTEKRTSGEIS
mmetsp:Transcript_14518/g.37629  ORF Transcript_14518/g.37629 Transcript_14518/m.37629 type:complete len:281 (-) Transcript_14518:517-1359(-)